MTQLKLTLLGMPQIKLDDQLVSDLPSRKARALLIYLALTRQTHSRQQLAGFLWREMTEENARRNLRVLLARLRKQLQPFLDIQRRELSINLDGDIWIDVVEFESCLTSSEPTLQQLHRAAKLYQGHFLDGFDLRGALAFEGWQRPLREHYRQMAMDALYRLAVYHTKQKQYSKGIDFTGQLLTLEPWMEEAHRQMMLLQVLSGQRTAALTQYETCRDVLMEEIGVEPSEATTTLYHQILNEEIDADMDRPAIIPSPEPTAWTPPFQTPAQPPHFVGRAALQDEITEVIQMACSREGAEAVSPPLHALIGMGGVGKSTLAIQLAHALRDDFPDGVLWANVATSEPMSILESWAQLYGYDFTRIADVENMAAAFRSALADKSVLIVLDDVTSVARIRPLLPTGDQNQVLLTTRDQDLAHALHAKVWPLAELSQANGRLLFTNLLGEERVDAEPDAAADICNLLQNLPLAVEITAQRLKSRPRRKLVDVAARLKDETTRLSQLNISDQGVRASFGISWETLDEGLRQVFCVMGLFNGRSFTAAAIAYILDQDSYLTEDRLFALTNLSLVSEEGQTRYRQHALLADFAREKLGEGEEGENGLSPRPTAASRRRASRLAHHYLQFAQRHPHDYNILRPEWDNMMAAMQTAHDHQMWQTVIDFADALHDAWFTRGRFTQAQQGFQWALHAAEHLDIKIQKANILFQMGRAHLKQSKYTLAKQVLIESQSIFRGMRNFDKVASVKYELAEISNEQADFLKASKLLQECLDIRKQLPENNPLHFADIYYKLADNEFAKSKNPDEDKPAKALFKQALEIYESEKEKLGIIRTLRKLASIAIVSREYEQAEKNIQKANILCDEIGDKHEQALLLYNLASIYLFSFLTKQTNTLSKAHENGEMSLQLHIWMGDQRSQAQSLWLLSRVDYYNNNYQSAIERAKQGMDLCDKIEDNSGRIFIREHLGNLYNAINQPMDAYEIWNEAHELAASFQHPLADKLFDSLNNLNL